MSKSGKLSRVFDREWILKIIFASSFGEDSLLENYYLIKENNAVTLSEFGIKYLRNIENHLDKDELLSHIKSNLEKVDFDQTSKLCQVLMQMGTYEMLYCPDIPAEVIINETVRLAGLFVEDREKRLLNKVLDNLLGYFKEKNLLYSEFNKI